jgi:hypothetical protein
VSEEMAAYMTKPERNDTLALPRRGGPRGLLPSTWERRTLRVEYVDADGCGREITATLLDACAAGPILLVAGARTVIAWDRLALLELVDG